MTSASKPHTNAAEVVTELATGLADDAARREAMRVHDRTYLVEAGAGSGKTAVLAGRMVMLLAAGVAPKSIVAVTFTELAASELLLRVREYVHALIAGEVPSALSLALAQGLGSSERQNLSAALNGIDEITCSTIHGFCQQLIKPYPVAADLDPGASVMDRDQADLTFEETSIEWLRAALDVAEETSLASLVWHDQAEALRFFRVVLESLRQAPDLQVYQPIELEAQWREFEDAVTSFSGFLGASPVEEPDTLEILHCLLEISQAPAADNEIERLLEIMSVHSNELLFTQKGTPRAYRKKTKWERAAQRAGLSKAEAGRQFASAKAIYELCVESLSAARAVACSRLGSLTLDDLRPVIAAYRQHKRATAQLDFDDLISSARDLLCQHEDIRVALGKRYTHVLVDEFQDTDPMQTEIFWRLCGDVPAGQSDEDWTNFRIRPGALFLVGDPKQAIYRFRGADVAAYVRARELLVAADAGALLQISTNFRSLAPILDHVNERFEEPLSESNGQPGFTPLAAFRVSADTSCVVRLVVNVEPNEEGRVSVEVQRQAEAEAVADLCARLIGSEIFDTGEAESRICKPGDIALLAPSGTELWRYEAALERHAIPVATQAGKGLYRRQEIQDLIALTRVLADARDTLALGALLRGPLVGLSEESLLDMVAQLRAAQVCDQGGDDPESSDQDELPRIHLAMNLEAIENTYARDMLEKLSYLYRIAGSTTTHHLLSQAIELLHVRPILMRRHAGQAERVLANVDLYLSMSRTYAVRGLKAFAEAMTAAWQDEQRAPEGRPDAQEESVALFTMHAAKGLEWRVVVPINTMTQIRTPDPQIIEREAGHLFCPAFGAKPMGYEDARLAERDELDRENVRLWYVAATRAREMLVLPQITAPRRQGLWSEVVDLGIEKLPNIDLAHFSHDMPSNEGEAINEQTRSLFASEAEGIASVRLAIKWRSPSRDEHIATELVSEPAGEVFSQGEDALRIGQSELQSEVQTEEREKIQGGWTRGQIIHKLFEEVLTGEVQATEADLTARAEVLTRQLGKVVSDDAAAGLEPKELAGCVLRGLSLPQVAEVRPGLVPECRVFGSRLEEDGENAFAGFADAIAMDQDSNPEVVIDWKTDVKPAPSQVDHYREQVRAYLELTGAKRGLIVLVTSGRVLELR